MRKFASWFAVILVLVATACGDFEEMPTEPVARSVMLMTVHRLDHDTVGALDVMLGETLDTTSVYFGLASLEFARPSAMVLETGQKASLVIRTWSAFGLRSRVGKPAEVQLFSDWSEVAPDSSRSVESDLFVFADGVEYSGTTSGPNLPPVFLRKSVRVANPTVKFQLSDAVESIRWPFVGQVRRIGCAGDGSYRIESGGGFAAKFTESGGEPYVRPSLAVPRVLVTCRVFQDATAARVAARSLGLELVDVEK